MAPIQGEEPTMTISNPRIPQPPGGKPGGLRPELAAYFALAARDFPPRRRDAETGILAELRMRRGLD